MITGLKTAKHGSNKWLVLVFIRLLLFRLCSQRIIWQFLWPPVSESLKMAAGRGKTIISGRGGSPLEKGKKGEMFRQYTVYNISGGSRGGHHLLIIFRPNWGQRAKGRVEKSFLRPGHLLISGSGWPSPPPLLLLLLLLYYYYSCFATTW